MNRPYIICHMVTSVDGKVTGKFLADPNCQSAIDEYYRIHRAFLGGNTAAEGFICGRKTMEESFTKGAATACQWEEGASVSLSEPDFIGEPNKKFFAVAFDSHARLGWETSHIADDDEGYDNAHIIEVITREVHPKQLEQLREIGVSYIFAGDIEIDVELALRKLRGLFDINILLLEGGSDINGAFLKAGAVDKLSLVTAPLIAGNPAKPLFGKCKLKSATLDTTQPLGDAIWSTYHVNR